MWLSWWSYWSWRPRQSFYVSCALTLMYPVWPWKLSKVETAQPRWVLCFTLSHCLSGLMVRNFFSLCVVWTSFNIASNLPLHTAGYSQALLSWWPPIKHWQVALRSPQEPSLLHTGRAQLPQPLLTGQVFHPVVILVVLCWTWPILSMPFMYWGAQSCTSHKSWVERAVISLSLMAVLLWLPACCWSPLLPGHMAGSRSALHPFQKSSSQPVRLHETLPFQVRVFVYVAIEFHKTAVHSFLQVF